jgi:death-on-curing protein
VTYLTLDQVLDAHRAGLSIGGGSDGIRDRGALESAVAQPAMAFGGQELYETIFEKAAALGYSLVMNHPFIDGNKRAGFLAMDTFLRLNGFRIAASVDEGERMILRIAAGEGSREELIEWLRGQCVSAEK